MTPPSTPGPESGPPGKTPGSVADARQYLADQADRVAIIAHRDPAHVPHYRPLRIEIGGADKQNAALDPLSGDFLQKSGVYKFLDQSRHGASSANADPSSGYLVKISRS